MTKQVIVYCDGGCIGNPGPGGYGAIIEWKDEQKIEELGAHCPDTTNNRMELSAAISALKSIDPQYKIEVHSDSQYVVKGITEWIHGWVRKSWRGSSGPVMNQDLWKELLGLSQRFENLSWYHVKAHSGVLRNERADTIANGFANNQSVELYLGPSAPYPH